MGVDYAAVKVMLPLTWGV